ncbi:MAG TPA: DUF4389 domain-containing protein [Solirubrobacteraceae bacterium]|jgi:hypothetical protein|nr:DUF4389 domain-containing protein [Solirubrobacteraceae bacterium]
MESSGAVPPVPPGDAPPPPGGTPPLPPAGGTPPPPGGEGYPLTYSVDYPDRPLNRITTALRIFWAIPIFILAASIEGGGFGTSNGARYGAGGGVGILVVPVLLMLLFRKKYPRWWWEWNLQLTRFSNRVFAYLALMDDCYPSTDEQQAVHLDFPYPDAERDLQRGMPLIKWLLAIPHYVVLFFLDIGALLVLIGAWFAIVITARYPRGLFDYVEGVIRWHNRVGAYAFLLITDRYPPFSLRA